MALVLHALPASRAGGRAAACGHRLRQHADPRATPHEEAHLADAWRIPRLRRHAFDADLQPRLSAARPDQEARGLGGHEEGSRAPRLRLNCFRIQSTTETRGAQLMVLAVPLACVVNVLM